MRTISRDELNEIIRLHKKWLESNGNHGERADLRNADIRGADITYQDLNRVNFGGSIITNCDFTGTDLRGCHFHGTDIIDCQLRSCDLRAAIFKGCLLKRSDLYASNIRLSDLSGCYLTGCSNILSYGPMPTSGRIIYAIWHGAETGWMVQAGCFWGNLDVLEKRVKETHNCPVYLDTINILRNHKPEESRIKSPLMSFTFKNFIRKILL